MKDPSSEILTAFLTALSSITYNGTTWPAYKIEPTRGKQNYIYLSDLSLSDASDQDHNSLDGVLVIQISTKKDKYARAIANSLSNSILVALVNIELSMTNYSMTIESITQDVNMTEEIEQDRNFIKTIALNFQTQEK